MIKKQLGWSEFLFEPENSVKFFEIEKNEVTSEEQWLGLNFFPPITRVWYNPTGNPVVVYPRGDDFQKRFLEINVGLSTLKQVYKRSCYSGLDWVGDVGGLLDGLRFIGALVMGLYKLI